MAMELLTPREMADADRLTISSGPFDGMGLMQRAGAAVAATFLARFPTAVRADVLCGPGNNGGDGYVVARLLTEAGIAVAVWADGAPRKGSDAATAAAESPVTPRPLSDFRPTAGGVVVDALFGAGLSKPVDGAAAEAIRVCAEADMSVLAVDLPSGVSGESGEVLGAAFRARITVTFARKKPGHLLEPGRSLCGEIVLADIGISDAVIAQVAPTAFENGPALWGEAFPRPAVDAHKYSRGHVGVFSGGLSATGAARLSAMASARIGAGAVTMLSPGNAIAANAAHLTSIILRKTDSMEDVQEFLEQRKPAALVFGPGLGPHPKVGRFAIDLIAGAKDAPKTIVLDADAITSLAQQPDDFFAAAGREGAPALVITPHTGEFGRLFPDIAADGKLSKLAKARAAAKRANATLVFKGPDTVIAAPTGYAAINGNGTPLLATAGSGDVLSGMIAGLAAQGMPPFEAACAAVWMHAEAARRFGPGLIAEDLPLALLPVLRELVAYE